MSHKIAKRVRKMLKSEGVDVAHAFYTRDEVTGSIVLDKSGRKLYKEAKRIAKVKNS